MRGKRRLAALLLTVALLMGTVPPLPARAAEAVYFTAINDNIVPLTDATMPFWRDGYLYIAGSVFSGYVRENIGITYTYNASKNLAALYASGKSGKSLAFDLNTGYTQDHTGNRVYRPAVKRGSEIFVQAALVADYFKLQYSVIRVEKGYLVWLREQDSILSAGTFADAATYIMDERYEDYRKEKYPGLVPEDPLEGVAFEGKRLYLCFEAAEPAGTVNLLDTLDRQSSQGAFFCAPELLEAQGDLLRRMTAMGHAIGIRVDGEAEESVLDQAERGNRAICQATCGMTRLVYADNADDQTLELLRQAGYACLTEHMNAEAQGLRSEEAAETLLQRVSAQRGDAAVWLGRDVSAVGLRAFLTAAREAEDACIALVETVV